MVVWHLTLRAWVDRDADQFRRVPGRDALHATTADRRARAGREYLHPRG